MEAALSWLLENADLKILVVVWALLSWRNFSRLSNAVEGLRDDLRHYRDKEECDVRHGQSCARLDKVENDVKELYKITGGKK